MPTLSSRLEIQIRWQPDADRERAELRRQLAASPPSVPSKYFYDDRGSRLFEAITSLDEYYLTRTERGLLRRLAPSLAERTGAVELVELGSGPADKTRILLDALATAGTLRRFLPLDVDESILRRTGRELVGAYPDLEVLGLVEDFTRDLSLPRAGGPRLILFLGSTLGNLPGEQAARFLDRVAGEMTPEDHLLLGLDLVKDRRILEAAYNDRRGLTARFNRNMLRVLNQRFGADFRPAAFAHRAFFDAENQWIEMHLVATRRQRVRIADLDLILELGEGDEIRTEISAKYDPASARRLFAAAALELVDWQTDEARRFALALLRPARRASAGD